jgi:WD40 repeat protein
MEGISASAVLRTHAYSVTSVDFNGGCELVSGDEGGWVFVWSLVTRRPTAVFRAHEKAVIKVQWFNSGDRVITHGRDNKLYIFQLGQELSTKLPTKNDGGGQWLKPLMVHSQDVNALNFCAFSMHNDAVIAVPGTLSSETVDVYELGVGNQLRRPLKAVKPSEETDASSKTGIVMALAVTDDRLAVGYESGTIAIFQWDSAGSFHVLASHKPHSQAALSLALHKNLLISSAADQHLVKYDISTGKLVDSLGTGHNGLQSASIRSDGKLLAVVGWDNMVRVFQLSNFKPLAAFKSSSQSGGSTIAFSPINPNPNIDNDKQTSSSKIEQIKRSKIMASHWLAAGGKDGRIGLFELY